MQFVHTQVKVNKLIWKINLILSHKQVCMCCADYLFDFYADLVILNIWDLWRLMFFVQIDALMWKWRGWYLLKLVHLRWIWFLNLHSEIWFFGIEFWFWIVKLFILILFLSGCLNSIVSRCLFRLKKSWKITKNFRKKY